MVIAEAPWLHTLGQIAGVLLLLEFGLVLLIACALAGGVAFGMWWLHRHVVPVLHQYTPQAQAAMQRAQQGSDKLVAGVAEFYSRRQAVETGLRVFLFGKGAAQQARNHAHIQAAADLRAMSSTHEIEEANQSERGSNERSLTSLPRANTSPAGQPGQPVGATPAHNGHERHGGHLHNNHNGHRDRDHLPDMRSMSESAG